MSKEDSKRRAWMGAMYLISYQDNDAGARFMYQAIVLAAREDVAKARLLSNAMKLYGDDLTVLASGIIPITNEAHKMTADYLDGESWMIDEVFPD